MADNLTAQSSAPATPPAATIYRSYFDGTEHHLPGVCEYVSGGSAGAWTLQQVDGTHGLPTNLYAVGGVAFNIGQQTSNGSLSVVIASDQAVSPADPSGGSAHITAQDAASTSNTNSVGQVIVTGSPTAGSAANVTLSGAQVVFITVSGNYSGTLSFERSSDGGTTWLGVSAEELTIGTAVLSITISDNKTYIFRVMVAGQTNFRVRCTNFVSGNALVALQPSFRKAAMAVLQSGSPWSAIPAAGTANGASLSRTISASGTNGTNVKASAGTLYSVRVTNFSTSAARYVKLYNEAGTPSVGSDTVFDTIAVPAAVSATQPSVVVWSGPAVGVAMGIGISFGITGGLADGDSTSISANDVLLTIMYK